MSTDVVGHDRHALVPGGGHRAGAAAQPRVRAAVPAPAGGGQGVGDARPAVRAVGRSSASGTGHVEGEFDALGVPFADRGRLLDEAIDAVRAALADEFATPPRRALAVRRRRPAAAARAAGACRSGSGGSSKPAMRRAAERGDGWLPQGPPEGGMAAGIDFVPRAPRRHAGRRPDRARRAVGPALRRRPDVGHAALRPRARPRRSPATCAPTPTSASTRSRSASSAARPTSCATRSPPSPPTSPRS